MATTKPYTSEEIALIVERMQPCKFFDMKTQDPIVLVSYYLLYKPGSRVLCNPDIVETIKDALTNAYVEGIREVGMVAPQVLQDALLDVALSVTKDPDWKIYPHVELSYAKTLLEVKQKIWDKALLSAHLETEVETMKKEVCDNLGFTDDVIDQLIEHQNITHVNELPENLRKLFSENPEKP